MRVLSLFSGIGGFDLGFERAGMTPVAFCEIEQFPQRVLRRHWPDVPIVDDVTKLTKETLPYDGPIDLICGGFPCQDLSVAGHRAGLAGERSGLFFEFMRIVAEITPRWVVIENVPGLLSSGSCKCDECENASGALKRHRETSDYACECSQCEEAAKLLREHRKAQRGQDFATLLEHLTGFRPEVPLGGWRNSGVCCGDRYGAAWRVLDAQYFGVAQRRRRVFIVGCLGDTSRAVQVLFEPESCERDTPPSRGKGNVSGTLAASGAGTSRPAGQGNELDFLVSHTLKAKGNDSQDPTHQTYVPDVSYALRSQASRADKPDSTTYVAQVVSTLTGGSGERGWKVNAENAAGGQLVAGVSANQRGEARLRNVHGSLTASRSGKQFDGVMVAPTLSTKNEVASSSTQRQAWMEQAAEMFGTVRRLTPVECERLQGFPDSWTAIDGDETPDSPRYRAIGNAVAVPVAGWIGKRILTVHNERTLAQG